MLLATCEGTVTGFGLANPKLAGKRDQARQMLTGQPANRPAPGTAIVTDKGLMTGRCGSLAERGDVVVAADLGDAGLGNGQAGTGAAVLVGEHAGDLRVVVVHGEAADEIRGGSLGGAPRGAEPGQCHGSLSRATLTIMLDRLCAVQIGGHTRASRKCLTPGHRHGDG